MLLSSLGLSGLQGTETSSTGELFISMQRQSKKWGQGCRGAFRKGWNQELEYSRDPAPRSSSARPRLLSGCPIQSRVSEQTDCPASSIRGAEGGHPQLEFSATQRETKRCLYQALCLPGEGHALGPPAHPPLQPERSFPSADLIIFFLFGKTLQTLSVKVKLLQVLRGQPLRTGLTPLPSLIRAPSILRQAFALLSSPSPTSPTRSRSLLQTLSLCPRGAFTFVRMTSL